MSTARAFGFEFAVWIPGLPTTTFSRTMVWRVAAATSIPLVLPVTLFASMTLPEAVPMTPIPKSSAGSEYPFPCVAFSRTRLLCPATHMPPHEAPAPVDPFRTDTMPSTSVPKELPAMNTPAPQLVDAVMSWTRTSFEAATETP
jgi:hypothetical protein